MKLHWEPDAIKQPLTRMLVYWLHSVHHASGILRHTPLEKLNAPRSLIFSSLVGSSSNQRIIEKRILGLCLYTELERTMKITD